MGCVIYAVRSYSAAMRTSIRPTSNKIRVGYSRHGSRWVSRGGAGRGWQNFSRRGRGRIGRAGSMLALVATGREPIGGRPGAPRSRSTNGGFPPFLSERSGHVAWRHVARPCQGVETTCFCASGRLIANLTTRAGSTLIDAIAPGLDADRRGGPSPLRSPRTCPHAPRVRRERSGENLRGHRTESRSTVSKKSEPLDWQMGSGVTAPRTYPNPLARGAESSRTVSGQGHGGDVGPLDVGKCRTLWVGLAGVN